MDSELSRTIDVIQREGKREPGGEAVALAIDYLLAVVPVNTLSRSALLRVQDNLMSYQKGQFSGASGLDSFSPVLDAIEQLRSEIEDAELPEIRRPRTPAELIEVAELLTVRPDWHEPDEQGVGAAYVLKGTDGGFDNAGHSVLEQYVVIYQDLVPVAEVALATVFAWACHAGRQQPQGTCP